MAGQVQVSDDFRPEPGIAVRLVSPAELTQIITSGELSSQIHLGALLLATLRSFLKLETR